MSPDTVLLCRGRVIPIADLFDRAIDAPLGTELPSGRIATSALAVLLALALPDAPIIVGGKACPVVRLPVLIEEMLKEHLGGEN